MLAKIIGAALATGLAIVGGCVLKQEIEENALLERDLAAAEAQLLEERRAREASDRSRESYLDEISKLEADRAARPARPVRVCKDVPGKDGAGVGAPGGSGGAVGEVAAGGSEPPTAGPDIGPELYAAADDADLDLAACRAFYGLVKARGLIRPSSLSATSP